MGIVTQRHRKSQTLAAENWADIPARVLATLAYAGIRSPEEWRTAGKRRKLIFGVTAAMAKRLDAAARRKAL